MKISKQDALRWFAFFAELPDDEPLGPRQTEIAYATLAQLESAVEARRESLKAAIPGLASLSGRTWYVGDAARFPAGCRSCLFGTGLGAIRRTSRCNLACPFCYDYGVLDQQEPVGEGMWEIGGTKFYERDLDLLLSVSQRPTGVCYVYLEPFCEIELYEGVIRKFHQAGIWQHMYTNGTLCDEQNLRMLGEAGLDELRFNLGATDCSDRVIERIAMAKRWIPHVGIETPMTPRLYESFLLKKNAILSTGLDFVNFAELHLNANNLVNYEGESLYACRQGYISPVWSRDLTLQIMRIAAEEQWPLCVHDCSNMTKFARDLNLRAKEGGWFGASSYGMEFDRLPFAAFLPALEDESLPFVEEEPLPPGYRLEDCAW